METRLLLERLDHLIQMGEKVVATNLGSVGGRDRVDASLFQQWRSSALSLLSMAFSKSSIHFQEFNTRCNVCWHHEAESGVAVLRAAKDDIEAGSESLTHIQQLDIEQLPLHPRIAAVCIDLYRDGHFSNAVYDASKALNNFVKECSGRHDIDGASLMRTVFSKNTPILAFNDLKNQSDFDEQEGMMHLYEGVALGIRNPRGHDFPEDSADRALEYICLISMLANRLNETLRVRVTND